MGSKKLKSVQSIEGKVPTRVLVGFQIEGKHYKPDQVVAFDEKQARQAVDGGNVDAHPEAVEYAMEQGAEVIIHTAEADEA